MSLAPFVGLTGGALCCVAHAQALSRKRWSRRSSSTASTREDAAVRHVRHHRPRLRDRHRRIPHGPPDGRTARGRSRMVRDRYEDTDALPALHRRSTGRSAVGVCSRHHMSQRRRDSRLCGVGRDFLTCGTPMHEHGIVGRAFHRKFRASRQRSVSALRIYPARFERGARASFVNYKSPPAMRYGGHG